MFKYQFHLHQATKMHQYAKLVNFVIYAHYTPNHKGQIVFKPNTWFYH